MTWFTYGYFTRQIHEKSYVLLILMSYYILKYMGFYFLKFSYIFGV